MKNKFLLLLLSVLVSACVTSTPKGFNKPNFSYNAYAPDIYECAHKAKVAKEAAKQAARSAPQNGNNVGGSFASGFVTGYSSQESYKNTAMSCMNGKGYVFEEMTAEERDKRLEASAEYHKIKHPEKYQDQ